MRSSPPYVFLALLCCFLSFLRLAIAQQSLAFTFPPPASVGTKTYFNLGENVHFTWTSSYPTTSLQLWQGPDDKGRNPHIDLLVNVTSATTTYTWSAHALKGLARDVPLHLYLFNSNNPNCDTCHANSSNFFVQVQGSGPSPSKTSSSPASTSTSTSPAAGDGKSSGSKLGLGLGLGLGIPLGLLIIGIATWFVLRNRRKQWNNTQREQDEPLADWKQAPPSRPTDSAGDYYGSAPADVKSPAESDGANVWELPAGHKPHEAAGGQAPMELEGESVSGPTRGPGEQTKTRYA